MQILFTSNHPSFTLEDEDKYIQKGLNLLKQEGFDKDLLLNTVFMTDEDLLQVNKDFLNHNYYTDIITFPIEEDEDLLEAEIYISVDRVKDNAMAHKVDFDLELLRVFLHGILHLVGYKDTTEEEKKQMRKKEDFYIQA